MSGIEVLAGVAMGFLGSIPLAGPVALLVMTRGISGDIKGAGEIAIGAAVAEGLLAGAVFAGLGALYTQYPQIEDGIEWVGALALVAIGLWFLIRGVSENSAGDDVQEERPGRHSLGFMLVIGNPGMIGTWGAALAALEGTGFVHATATGALGLGLGVIMGVCGWFFLMLRIIQAYESAIKISVINRVVRALGAAIAIVGAHSILSLIHI